MHTPKVIRRTVVMVTAMSEYLSDGRVPDGVPPLLSLDRAGVYSRWR